MEWFLIAVILSLLGIIIYMAYDRPKDDRSLDHSWGCGGRGRLHPGSVPRGHPAGSWGVVFLAQEEQEEKVKSEIFLEC